MTSLLVPKTAEQLYNESLKKTRNSVERTFGVSKRKFPIMALGMRFKLANVLPVIVALTLDLGLSASVAGSCCIFTLAVRQPPVLASCIEIYYFDTHTQY